MKNLSSPITCPLCGTLSQAYTINEANIHFLEQRLHENKLDDALTLCQLSWNNFPGIRQTSETKTIINGLMKGIEDQVNNALKPLDLITKIIFPLSKKLDDLTSKLPENLKTEFDEINSQLARQLLLINDATTKSSEPVQRDLRELSLNINALINKPNLIGVVKEKTVELFWQEVFTKDKVDRRGAPGQPDLVIEPFVEFGGGCFGPKIIIERKGGKQRYCGTHLQQLFAHSRAEGARFGLLLYDNSSNLLEKQKPICLTTVQEVTVCITDVESGGWKTAREIFEVFQALLPVETNNPLQQIDLKKFQMIIEEMASVNEQIETLRKCNNATISNCDKTRMLINRLEESILTYQGKLRDLLPNKIADARRSTVQVEFPVNKPQLIKG